MYLIQKRRFAVKHLVQSGHDNASYVGNQINLGFLQFSQVPAAAVPFKQYGITNDLFIKFFRVSDVQQQDMIRRLNAELMCGQVIESMGHGPKVMGICGSNRFCGIVIERILSAKTLVQWSLTVSMRNRRTMAIDIAKFYRALVRKGIYWNDFRDHNILVDKDGRFLFIDLELASPIELENNGRRALHTLWHLATNERWEEYHSGAPTDDLVFYKPCTKSDHVIWSQLKEILT